jgi:hypothetical protein
VLTAAEDAPGQAMLIRIVSMLTKLGQRRREMRQTPGRDGNLDYDNDDDGANCSSHWIV